MSVCWFDLCINYLISIIRIILNYSPEMAVAYRNSTHPINTRHSILAKRWLINLKLIIGNENKYRQKVNSKLINNAQSLSLTTSFADKCTSNCILHSIVIYCLYSTCTC